MPNYYDRIADTYDATRGYPAAVIGAVVDFVLSDRDRKLTNLIDVGAGTGLLSIPLARAVRRVVAVDVSHKMLEVLDRKASAEGLTNIETKIGAAQHLPVPTAGFDVAITSHVLHLTDRHKSMGEIKRVLQNGGAHFDCQCNWPEHRRKIESIWLASKGGTNVTQSMTVDSRPPDLRIPWRLEETVGDRLAAYEGRAHGSCWDLGDEAFANAFSQFKYAVLKEYGSESQALASESHFEVFVTPRSRI